MTTNDAAGAARLDEDLQDSLDQIERLAAELKQIADVISTPEPDSVETAAFQTAEFQCVDAQSSPQSVASETERGAGSSTDAALPETRSATPSVESQPEAEPSMPSGALPQEIGAATPMKGARTARPTNGPEGPMSRPTSAPIRRNRAATPSDPVATQEPTGARRAEPPRAAGAEPTATTRAEPTATTGTEAPVDTVSATGAPTSGEAKGGSASGAATASDSDSTPTEPGPTGRSVVRPPLAPEPSRAGDFSVVFGVDPAGDVPAEPATSVRAPSRPASAAAGVATVPTAASRGTERPSKPALLPTARARREQLSDERTAVRSSDWSVRRRVAALAGVAALAIPAFAAAAMQPWQSGDSDVLGALGAERDAGTASEGHLPELIPQTSPTPSTASAPDRPGAGLVGLTPAPGGPAAPVTVRSAGPVVPSVAPPVRRRAAPVGLAVQVRADDVQPMRGDAVRFRVLWKDGSGIHAGSTQQWGDGTPTSGSVSSKPCTGTAPAGRGDATYVHTFQKAGTYIVRLSVTTYTCDGSTETQTVPMTIVVSERPQSPPSASPEPEPSPSAETAS